MEIDPNITSDKRFVPTDVYLEVTSFCNASCYMCPHKDLKRKKGHMSWKIFKKVVDECSEIEGKGIYFFLHYFGEPLLDPLLPKRIKYIKDKCKTSYVSFSTNGSLLTKEKSEQILKAGLDYMVFSLDSINPKTFSEMRGLNLDTVLKNINDLIEVRDRLKSKVSITMQMVLCEKNKHEEKAFKEMWADKKVRIVIKGMHNMLTQGTSYMTKKLTDKQLLPCMQPFMQLMVYWNGDLGLCCWDANHYMDLGNIRDKPVLEAFNTEPYKKIREAMLTRNCKDIYPCNICSQIYGYDMNVSIFNKKLRIKM
jgi:MoaA/NifB/PqqE/SkfB family radical SAM enzyme